MTFYTEFMLARDVGSTTSRVDSHPIIVSKKNTEFLNALPAPLPPMAKRRMDFIRLSSVTVRGDTGRVFDEDAGLMLSMLCNGSSVSYHDVRPSFLRRPLGFATLPAPATHGRG